MMKRSMKLSAMLIATLAMAFIVMAFTDAGNTPQDDKWVAPPSADKMKNPTEASSANLKIGKNLFYQHCKSCHGAKGLGDGPKAAELDTPCGDFSTEAFQAQSDGSLFWKTKEGNGDMPSFKKKISEDEDVWLIVNYMRSLAE